MFDWIKFFEDYGVEYTTQHKHVTKGWVNIHCPFCVQYGFNSDHNFHLGVSLHNYSINCWRCGTHSVRELIQEIAPDENVNQILYRYRTKKPLFINISQNKDRYNYKKTLELEPEFEPISNGFARYLKHRNFNPMEIQNLYNVMCAKKGEWKGRIIIPYYENGILVSWSGRAINDSMKPKMKNLSSEKSLKTTKQVLYNYSGQEWAVITEGVFDAWRFGINAVSVSGVKVTPEQFKIMQNIAKIFICFDTDVAGVIGARELYYKLKFFNKDVYLILLNTKNWKWEIPENALFFDYDVKDLADLNNEQVTQLKQKIKEVL